MIREKGAQNVAISFNKSGIFDIQDLIKKAQKFDGLLGKDLAKDVTCKKSYSWDLGVWSWGDQKLPPSQVNNKNVIDTLALARDKFPGSPISLDALCKRYRVDNSKRTQHTALIDCDLLAKVYINLLDQKEPTLNFQNDDNQKLVINSNDNNQYYKKIIKPSEEDLKLHKEYLKNNLKKNFFN